MANLSSIQEKHQTKLFKKYFAFFAYSQTQLEEQQNINFKYVAIGSGLIVPKDFVKKVISKLDLIYKQSIREHQSLESKKSIIWGALANYETQITGDPTDAIESLADYPGISKEDIIKEYSAYFNHCVENDYF